MRTKNTSSLRKEEREEFKKIRNKQKSERLKS